MDHDNSPDEQPAQADDNDRSLSRRTLLKRTAAAAGGAAALSDPAQAKQAEDLFLPEEHWRDRMTAPDDGKK